MPSASRAPGAHESPFGRAPRQPTLRPMSVEPLEQAVRSTRGVLEGVKPDQMGLATPCASWKVSDLVNHIVGGQFFFAKVASGNKPERDPTDYSSGDFV